MTVLGFWVVVAAFGTSVLAAYRYYRAPLQKGATGPARTMVYASTASVVIASLLLLVLLLRHDFSNGYVFSYSSSDLPLYFILSSFYAGQEGSFLFWALCSALIAPVLLKYTARRKVEPSVMTIYMAVHSFLLLLVVTKTPFYLVWEKYTNIALNQIPLEGQGLNPLLQNFWMTLHPPVLFVGFAAMAVPFSFAVAGLWRRTYSLLVNHAFAWLLFAVFALGLGIILGAYWAYGVLGWGGYWGWDPVENSSLVPWLTGVAMIHTILAQRASGKYVRTNYLLAVVSFLLVIYSTFLTRSGVLGDASVHSFTDPGTAVYGLLLGLLAGIGVVGFGLLYKRNRELAPRIAEAGGWINRETVLGAGAIAVLLSAAVILFGTSLPIFSSSSVDLWFYDTTNLPIAMAMSILMGLALYVQWKGDDAREIVRRSWKTLAATILAGVAIFLLGVRDAAMLPFAIVSVYALFVNLEMGSRVARVDMRQLGGKLAHIGTALFFLGVISTGRYSEAQHLSLQLQEPAEALGYTLTYVGYAPTRDGKFAFHIDVEGKGRRFRVSPVMFDAGRQGIMRNPDIAAFLTSDFYVSPVSFEPQDHAHAHEVYTIPKGETVSMGDYKARFVRFAMDEHSGQSMAAGGGMSVGSVLELSKGATTETITPVTLYSVDGTPLPRPTTSRLMDATVQLVSMNVGTGGTPSTVTVEVKRNGEDHPDHKGETLVIEASVKPYINLLWGGTVLMMAGFVLAMVKRGREESS